MKALSPQLLCTTSTHRNHRIQNLLFSVKFMGLNVNTAVGEVYTRAASLIAKKHEWVFAAQECERNGWILSIQYLSRSLRYLADILRAQKKKPISTNSERNSIYLTSIHLFGALVPQIFIDLLPLVREAQCSLLYSAFLYFAILPHVFSRRRYRQPTHG